MKKEFYYLFILFVLISFALVFLLIRAQKFDRIYPNPLPTELKTDITVINNN